MSAINFRYIHKIPLEDVSRAALSYKHVLLNGAERMDHVTHKRGYPDEAQWCSGLLGLSGVANRRDRARGQRFRACVADRAR